MFGILWPQKEEIKLKAIQWTEEIFIEADGGIKEKDTVKEK